MKAVVLVGGEGTRLRPLTYDTPKPLLPIANRAFLDRQLEWLASHGVDEVVLSLGYLPDAFEAHFAASPAPAARSGTTPVEIGFAVEAEPLGTAGAIRFAAGDVDERVIVCNGDVLTTLDLGALVRFHVEHGAAATIHLTEVADPSAFGVVPTRPDGEVVAFVEKPAPGKAPTRWINAGTYVLEPSVLERIPPRLAVSVERETFPRMLEEPGLLYAVQSTEYWIDIGSPEQYLRAHGDVLAGRLGVPPGTSAREHAPGVWAQDDVGIDPSATLVAPVLLGAGTVVGPGARVQGSSLGAGTRVDADVRLLRAVLHDGAHVASAAEVADSVIGAGATVGTGARVGARSLVGAGAAVPPHARVAGAKLRRECPVRVVVSGGAGFIGSTLVDRLLAEGCDVDAIDDLSAGALVNLGEARARRNRRFSFHRLDVRSPQLVELVVHRRPEVIFHLAAQLDVRRSVRRPIHDAEVNILGSLNVCEAAVAGGTRKVVFAGSGGTLYGAPESVPVRESHPQRPISPYGVSKKAAGDYLHVYREVHGLEYTDLLLAHVYGPRQDPHREVGVVAVFAGALLGGRRPTIYGDGTQTRDFLFVDDAVDAFVRAAERGGGLRMNIGTGVETSVGELFRRVATLVGTDDEPAWAAPRDGEVARSVLDPGRAAIQLGWRPWTSLDDGLASTVDWFRAQLGE